MATMEAKKSKAASANGTVDTTGMILQVLVHEANIQDYRGGKRLLAPLTGVFPRLKLIWADSGYKKEGFEEWGKRDAGLERRDRGTSLERPTRRLGAQGCGDRLGTDPTQRLSGASTPLDCRAHLRLALHLAQALQRL